MNRVQSNMTYILESKYHFPHIKIKHSFENDFQYLGEKERAKSCTIAHFSKGVSIITKNAKPTPKSSCVASTFA